MRPNLGPMNPSRAKLAGCSVRRCCWQRRPASSDSTQTPPSSGRRPKKPLPGPRTPRRKLDRIWADGEQIQEIEELLLRRKVVAAVLERAKVEDVPMSFSELALRRRERLAAGTEEVR